MFHPDCSGPEPGTSGGSMRKTGLLLMVLTGILLSKTGYAQQPPAQPTPAVQIRNANFNVGNVPTPNDMYCSGFITNEHVSEKLFVAGGHNSPDQSRYAGVSVRVFIHGQGMNVGGGCQFI